MRFLEYLRWLVYHTAMRLWDRCEKLARSFAETVFGPVWRKTERNISVAERIKLFAKPIGHRLEPAKLAWLALLNRFRGGPIHRAYLYALINIVEPPKFKWFHLIWLVKAALKKPVGISFDIANRCPINCDCQWRAFGNEAEEMTDKQFLSFLRKQRRRGIESVTLIGGEPLVREDLILACTEKVRGLHYNVVTSGTSPFRPYKGCSIAISIDGANAETHNGIRNSPRLYERILKNLLTFRLKYGFVEPLYIHTTANAINYRQIGDELAFWSRRDEGLLWEMLRIILATAPEAQRPALQKWGQNELPKLVDGLAEHGMVTGVEFSSWVPVSNAGDEEQRLSDDQLRSVVAQLRTAKIVYGDFLMNSPAMIERLLPERLALQTPDNCDMAKMVTSYFSDGEPKPLCVFGPLADCGRCGCASKLEVDLLRGRDKETARSVQKKRSPGHRQLRKVV